MPERFARVAALALIVVLLIALPLLVSLFGALTAPAPAPTPTVAIAVVPPTDTPLPATDTPAPPTETTIPPTLTSIPTITTEATIAALSPTPCVGPATPEPLWVNPVTSPTDQLTQDVSVTLGRGREITIASEGGSVSQKGEFSTNAPVILRVPLAPNLQNNLIVTGTVEYSPGCFYTLQARTDRNGAPLIIVQQETLGAQVIPTFTPTPGAPGTVYLQPFSQVFALNQDSVSSTDSLWLYTAPDPNSAFTVLDQNGAFTHVQSQGGTLNFWTFNENVATSPPPPAEFDDSVAGTPVELNGSAIFACEAQYPRPLILGMCTNLTDVSQGEAVQRATTDGSVLYLVRINNRLYWVSSNVLKSEPQ